MNGFDAAPVTIRPMRREDVEALAGWERHADPRFAQYDVGPLTPEEGERLWRALSEPPARRRPFVAMIGERVVGQILLRPDPADAATAELGIMVDPALIGQGLGRRILRIFAGYCAENRFKKLTLEVDADNERAIRAYRAAGFVARGERTAPPDAGAAPVRILRMETELPSKPFTEREACERP
jgi:RimJ/RimL family protein N-acetyltransferase